MNILPKIIHCPCCDGINIKRVNGIVYKNEFKSLEAWSLKKIFNCRKCGTELGLFSHINQKLLKVIWIDFFKCEDSHFYELNKLQIQKKKLKKNYKRYNEVLTEINSIQNQIRSDQTKIKIKFKLEHKGMLI